MVFAYAGADDREGTVLTPELPELTMSGRDWHVVAKALVVAVAAIERMPEGPYRPDNDVADMKALVDRMLTSDAVLPYYARSAQIALSGKPEEFL